MNKLSSKYLINHFSKWKKNLVKLILYSNFKFSQYLIESYGISEAISKNQNARLGKKVSAPKIKNSGKFFQIYVFE